MDGTLDTFSVVEILQMLGRTRRSGTLHIECPQRLVDVRFALGRIAETRDSARAAADAVIGSQLLKRALVDVRHLEEALAEQEARPRPLGTILVERGAVAEDALREVLSRQIANTLVAAKLETDGSFVFVLDPEPQTGCITVDTQAVLLDISAVGGEYCLAVEMLGQASTVLVRNGDYQTLPRNPVAMARDEFTVLLNVDGERTVKEITQASHLEEIVVVNILGRLAEAGVLLVKSEGRPSDEDAAELQAHRDAVWAEVSRLLDDIADQPGRAGEKPAAADAGRPLL